ncbi:MAG TPA: hypothetical protein VFE06_07630 [Acidobacteriaceae bacterium]|nr:hypothetical protein [Acidobacteriaceae bacterium]
MLYVRIIVGFALLLMAAFGPGIGIRPATRPRHGADAIGQANADHARTGGRDQKMAAVLILRILAAMLGFWLLFYSIAQLLHHPGHL